MDSVCVDPGHGCVCAPQADADPPARRLGVRPLPAGLQFAEPNKHFADWWEIYGDDLFHQWLERQ